MKKNLEILDNMKTLSDRPREGREFSNGNCVRPFRMFLLCRDVLLHLLSLYHSLAPSALVCSVELYAEGGLSREYE